MPVLALITTVFVSSVLGSLHCAGMCGAFLAMAVAGGEQDPSFRVRLQAAYHGGRLVSYVMLGVLAGFLGSAVELAGAAAGWTRSAAILSGVVLVLFGAGLVLRSLGVRVPRVPVLATLSGALVRLHRVSDSWPPAARAMFIGLLTTLLPCGWLWAFVATAAGTGDGWRGALAMAVFWLGTLPVMIALGAGLQRSVPAARRFMPIATSVLLVAVGVATLLGRTLPGVEIARSARGEVTCHGR
jgi:sulfite exporter TauE/SafE